MVLQIPHLNLTFHPFHLTGLLNHAQELAAEQSNPNRRLPSNEQELEFEVSALRLSTSICIFRDSGESAA